MSPRPGARLGPPGAMHFSFSDADIERHRLAKAWRWVPGLAPKLLRPLPVCSPLPLWMGLGGLAAGGRDWGAKPCCPLPPPALV